MTRRARFKDIVLHLSGDFIDSLKHKLERSFTDSQRLGRASDLSELYADLEIIKTDAETLASLGDTALLSLPDAFLEPMQKRYRILRKFIAREGVTRLTKVILAAFRLRTNLTRAKIQIRNDSTPSSPFTNNAFLFLLGSNQRMPLPADLRAELDKYIRIGAIIREDESFTNSTMDFLDRMSAGISNYFLGDSNVLLHGALVNADDTSVNPADIFLPNAAHFDSAFIALAAPSLEGKTQSAFIIRRSKVLYFVIEVNYPNTRLPVTAQPIYRCFNSPSRKLSELALADMAQVSGEKRSATELAQLDESKKLHVLGYFAALMQMASTVPTEDWIGTFATLSDFPFEPLSVGQFVETFQATPVHNRISVFLDEFKGDASGYGPFVRNLCRAVGVACIVANTNSNIANLVSSAAATSRATDRNDCWSVVFKRLNPVAKALLNPIKANLERVKNLCLGPDPSANASEVFDKLFGEVLLKSRPGIAVFLVDAVKKAVPLFETKPESKRSLAAFLQLCLAEVADEIISRKPNVSASPFSMIAKIGLHLEQAFRPDEPVKEDTLSCFRHHRHMQDHLFYLNNPVQPDKCIFLAFKNKHSVWETLQIFRSSAAKGDDWSLHYTSFNSEEFFTLLVCLNVALTFTVFSIMNNDFFRNATRNVSDAQNLLALKLPGNHLEVSVAASVADASQHLRVQNGHLIDLACSLEGVNGKAFLENLLLNSLVGMARLDDCKHLIFGAELIGFHRFLSNITVPFLYGINRRDPVLEQLNAVPELGFFVDHYRRPADSSQIDGVFSFRTESPQNSTLLETAAVECKNIRDEMNVTKLNGIIERLLTARARLAFVFCNDFKPAAKKSKLLETCKNRVNIYYVKNISRRCTTDGDIDIERELRALKALREEAEAEETLEETAAEQKSYLALLSNEIDTIQRFSSLSCLELYERPVDDNFFLMLPYSEASIPAIESPALTVVIMARKRLNFPQ